MPQDKHMILGVHIDDRIQKANEVQTLLTDYGCNIKTRIGLHEVTGDFCAGYGLILLEMLGEQTKAEELAGKLNSLSGVEVQQMIFGHS